MADHEDHGPVLGSGWIHLAATVLLALGGVMAYSFWDNAAKSADPAQMGRFAAIALGIGLLPWVINGYRLFRLRQSLVGSIFPDTEENERDRCGGDQEFCFAGNFGFGLPAKELRG